MYQVLGGRDDGSRNRVVVLPLGVLFVLKAVTETYILQPNLEDVP